MTEIGGMNGAESIIRAALASGLDTCFANPGTTEIPFVRALDEIPGVRPVLCLFEGVCTGAADGYGRMAGRPALTLLHLGPGFANGIAYLHDARRARSPVVNLIGEHATWHQAADAPLQSDIESLARPVSAWLRRAEDATRLADDLREAIEVASVKPGRISTLIIPHDLQLARGGGATGAPLPAQIAAPHRVSPERIEEGRRALAHPERVAILLGSHALRERALGAVARIQARTGVSLIAEAFPARWERGQGRPVITRLPYFPEYAVPLIAQYQTIILAGAPSPVSFFGYPGTPSHYIGAHQQTVELASPEEDVETALEELAEALTTPKRSSIVLPTGVDSLPDVSFEQSAPLTGKTMTAVVAALLPPGAIVMDEGHTSTGAHTAYFQSAAPHSYLTQPGGAIGLGMPCAIGAALACPERPVVTLQADGSGMYTVQALWTMAREGLNIKTIICNNSGYRIVGIEMMRAGVTRIGERARSLMEVETPRIDWVGVSRGLGVPAARVETPGELAAVLRRELAAPGPFLIDAVLAAE